VRFLPTLLLLAVASVTAAESQPAWPLWDNAESVAEYAKRANLPTTKTLDLGDGVKLEMVLIPAGKFTMGTEEPPPVNEESFRSKILTGEIILALGGGALMALLCVVLIRAMRKRQRPQYSLAWFLAMTVAAGIGLLGGLHWFYSARAFAQAQSEYEAAMARFKSSCEWENPAHEVTLTKSFYLGKFEVTQEQYQHVIGATPSQFKGRDLPVEQVSWTDAQEFCKKVSEKTGFSVRLPTDAEWEHACRAGTKTTYYTGDAETDLDRAGWYSNNSKGATHPVGQKTPNAWGVHDMHGNVWEWCADWFEAYKSEPAIDPQGAAQGQSRVLRGGSWDDLPWFCRSVKRDGYYPDARYYYFGCRVAVWASRTP
jgi:formylglycine-generating enzyme required for sulfatase activity